MSTKMYIENPELRKLYLIRRHVGGPANRRFQPGRILSIEKAPAPNLATTEITIAWLYDGETTKADMYFGLVRTLDRKWLDTERERVREELGAKFQEMKILDRLSFVPEAMQEVAD